MEGSIIFCVGKLQAESCRRTGGFSNLTDSRGDANE